MRILVTGSRDWTDEQAIADAMFAEAFPLNDGQTTFVLIEGACPIGADSIAHRIATAWGNPWQTERHPADWKRHGGCKCRPDVRKHCGYAGFRRNAEMVALGADVCLAFIKDGSKGATHCANLAEQAGIRTVRVTA